LVKSSVTLYSIDFGESLVKTVSLNFFCFMKSSKKNGAGPAEVYQ